MHTPRFLLLFVVVVAIAATGASCGGSTAATVASPSASPSPSASLPPTPAEVLTAYFAQAKPVRAQFGRIIDKMDSVLRSAHKQADSSWPATGKKIEKLNRSLENVRVSWDLLTPPPALKAAHKSYGALMRTYQQYYELAAYCLQNKFDMSDYSMYGRQLTALDDKASNQFDAYQIACMVQSRKLSVKIPWKWQD